MKFQEGCPVTINRPYTKERIENKTRVHQVEQFVKEVSKSPTIEEIEKAMLDIEASKGKLMDLECGDMVIEDSGDLGFDVYLKSGPHQKGEKILFINKIGERVLLDWLLEKNKNNPEWVEKNFKRIKKEEAGNNNWRKE